jgi:hypothetical protein
MSRAFVKEADYRPADLRDRPISTHPNLVTPEGFAAIERAINRFSAAYRAAVDKHDKAAIAAVQRELRYWSASPCDGKARGESSGSYPRAFRNKRPRAA